MLWALLQATQDSRYLSAGATIIDSLLKLNWVEGGWASVQSVHTRTLEDHMPSYFLAEACKYLYLLFDDSFLQVLLCLRHELSAYPGTCLSVSRCLTKSLAAPMSTHSPLVQELQHIYPGMLL